MSSDSSSLFLWFEGFSVDPLVFCRSAEVRETLNRKSVDENYNNVSSPSRGLAGKLQQLLTPTRNRTSVRRAASVDDRRPGNPRRTSDHKPSRKSQMAESLLKAKERLYNATSEVTPVKRHRHNHNHSI